MLLLPTRELQDTAMAESALAKCLHSLHQPAVPGSHGPIDLAQMDILNIISYGWLNDVF